MDVCEIGGTVASAGEIKQVKALGIMALIDEGKEYLILKRRQSSSTMDDIGVGWELVQFDLTHDTVWRIR